VIPDEEGAAALHRKHGSRPEVVEHCRTVARIALGMADEFEKRGVEVDREAVRAGALLHDIGRSKTQTVSHGVEGYRILLQDGVDQKVADIVRRHVGAGISPDEARRLGLPEMDYVPRSLEERMVCFSDKMVDGTVARPFQKEVDRFVAKGHDVQRLIELRRRLAQELGEDPEEVALGKIKESD
jgi:uncharacterized protein